MASIGTPRAYVPDTAHQHSYTYPNIPFETLSFARNTSRTTLAAMQQRLAQAWSPAQVAASREAPLDLGNLGLISIHSAGRLIPPWCEAVSLANNTWLNRLPNDLSPQLHHLSLRNNSNLIGLPQSLPHGLTVDVTGSGLRPEYLRAWMLMHPRANVLFFDDGRLVELERGAALRHVVQRDRRNWEARSDRGGDEFSEYAPPSFVHNDYERARYGQRYADARLAAEEDRQSDSDSDSSVGEESSHEWEADEEGIGLGDYVFDSESDTEAIALSEQLAEFSMAALEEDQEALDRAMSEAPPQQEQRTAPAGAVGRDAHHYAMQTCELYLAQKMAFWLGENPEHPDQAWAIAWRCADYLYALETDDDGGGKKRPAQEIVNEHVERLNEFAQTLDRIKDTASFTSGTADSRGAQRQKVGDLLRLMVNDKELCATALAAMKVAASTCPDALATEGLDMMETMCTTARSIQENWTPEVFYRRMEQVMRRDKVRAQVGDIVKRMKKEYRGVLMAAIEKNHRAMNATLFPNPGALLRKLVGEKHFVRRNGRIEVRYPDPDESPLYKANKEERKKYVALQVDKKVDDVEVLSLAQNAMQAAGLLSDVQGGLYTAMHHNNLYSDSLNVTAAELRAMAKSLSLGRNAILSEMTAWEAWSAYLDRNGHTEAVKQDPELKSREAELATQMEGLRETLTDLIEYEDLPAESAEDFSLLNNLISTVGTPVVNAHELLRRGGAGANAITMSDKRKRMQDGEARLSVIEEEAREEARRNPPPTSRRSTGTAAAGVQGEGERRRRHHHRSGTSSTQRADGRTSTRHRHRERDEPRDHRGHRSRREHRAADMASQSTREPLRQAPEAAVPETPETPVVPFAQARLELFREVMKQLKAQGDSPYEAALLRKTRALVEPALAPPATAVVRRRTGGR